MQTTGFYCMNPLHSSTAFDAQLFARYRAEAQKPKIDIEDAVITADNIGLDKELSDVDVIF
jgi:hypothetical protein